MVWNNIMFVHVIGIKIVVVAVAHIVVIVIVIVIVNVDGSKTVVVERISGSSEGMVIRVIKRSSSSPWIEIGRVKGRNRCRWRKMPHRSL